MQLRRHPSRVQLEAWFDGEAPDGVAWHVAGCNRCFAHVENLARLRQIVRTGLAAPPVPGHPAGPAHPVARPARRRRVLVGVPVVLALVAALAVGVSQVHLNRNLSSASDASSSSGTSHGSSKSPHGGISAPGGSSATSAQGPGSTVAGRAGSGSAGASPGTRVLSRLDLAVVVPTQGAAAVLGAQVAGAVEQAVSQANAAGGVGGSPVQLTVVSAEDAAAVAGLAGDVTAVIGGFGATLPADVPWILPADPYASGSEVVPAELSPAAAGVRLGQHLLAGGDHGTVGVVVGDGPDAALENGLAQELPVDVVDAPSDTTCLPALTDLLAGAVSALAVAGDPSLAATCLTDLAALAWEPSQGVLLPPSAAYAGVGVGGLVPGTSVLSVLGLPWPDSASAGASLFRSAVPGAGSYQALVSYAAAELALQVARSAGTLSMAAVSGGTWHSALYDYAGTANAGAQVVELSGGSWFPAA